MSDAADTARPGFIWLASQSPRRRALLDQIDVAHRLLLPTAEEDAEALEAERPGEAPEAYVERVTLAKLDAAGRRLARLDGPAAPILCADTTVALGASILGKPLDADDARRTLLRLSGRTHRVLTAVAIGADGRQAMALSTSHVRFAALPEAVVDAYVASGDPFGKAGAYGVQSRIAAWIERIEGSYSAIMGLPLFETARLLRQVGIGA